MKLPNLEHAFVPREKITRYLLDTGHKEGRGKALFFLYFGFSMAQWQVLSASLVQHAHEHEVASTEVTHFGTRYVIEGILHTPSGRTPQLRTVWFRSKGDPKPRLVTAYPLEE